MSNRLSSMFKPFQCKSLKVPNRFAMAPMTRYFSPDGILPTEAAGYYKRRAEGGIGLIISEGAGIDRESSRAVTFVPNFCGEEALRSWHQVIDEVHAAGAAMAPQLWHVGGVPDYNFPEAEHAPLESPSGFIGPELAGGKPMTEEDLADTIASYARAAVYAKELGADALEFHAAHGYLIDQFFWTATNRRTDRYGPKDFKARTRFACDMVSAVRREVGEGFCLLFRISQWKTGFYDAKVARDPRELASWLEPIADAGIDIFHCSQRRFWEPEFKDSDLNLAGWAKKVTGRPTITVGSIGLDRDLFSDFEQAGESKPDLKYLDDLERRFERGDFDMVAIGRALLGDAQWLNKIRMGDIAGLRPYSTEAMKSLS